jgi:branched-chain amino acid transport system ATP-binding protein
MSILKTEGIQASYGDLVVLREVSLHLEEGEIVAVVGSNGAGKTSLVRTISGLLRAEKGQILFEEARLNELTPSAIVNRGVILCPEGRKIFSTLTVRENLELGAYAPRARGRLKETLSWIYSFLPILQERKEQLASTLSGGEQQMLALARGLMGRPRLFMLDEPSLGLAPLFIKEIFKIVQEINRNGVTILLIEQDLIHALAVARRGYVLENGRITMEDQSQALLKNENVKQAYLGL